MQKSKEKNQPDASNDTSIMIDFQKFILRGDSMNEWLSFVHEKCVRNPNKVTKLIIHYKFLETSFLLKRQTRIFPVLSKVQVHSVVLAKIKMFSNVKPQSYNLSRHAY